MGDVYTYHYDDSGDVLGVLDFVPPRATRTDKWYAPRGYAYTYPNDPTGGEEQ